MHAPTNQQAFPKYSLFSLRPAQLGDLIEIKWFWGFFFPIKFIAELLPAQSPTEQTGQKGYEYQAKEGKSAGRDVPVSSTLPLGVFQYNLKPHQIIELNQRCHRMVYLLNSLQYCFYYENVDVQTVLSDHYLDIRLACIFGNLLLLIMILVSFLVIWIFRNVKQN